MVSRRVHKKLLTSSQKRQKTYRRVTGFESGTLLVSCIVFDKNCDFEFQRVLFPQRVEAAVDSRLRQSDETGVPNGPSAPAGHQRQLTILLRRTEKEGQAAGALNSRNLCRKNS